MSRHLKKALALAVLTWLALPAGAANDFSPAERALFMTNQLASLRPPVTLNYRFSKSGSLEAGFEDKVVIKLRAQDNGGCCASSAEFLSGPRRLPLPDVEAAEGNPAILYFLERDIREMSRLTKGQPNYFRKRIRMAVYQGAQIVDVTLPYQGKQVAGRQITIAPYLDDPLKARFEKLAGKQYVFTLSEAVPGGVYAIRARIEGESAGATPALLEEMVLDGAAAEPRKP
jgi:hypothetical protein